MQLELVWKRRENPGTPTIHPWRDISPVASLSFRAHSVRCSIYKVRPAMKVWMKGERANVNRLEMRNTFDPICSKVLSVYCLIWNILVLFLALLSNGKCANRGLLSWSTEKEKSASKIICIFSSGHWKEMRHIQWWALDNRQRLWVCPCSSF